MKYKAVLEVKRFAEDNKARDPPNPRVRIVLVAGRELAEPHITLRNMFGIHVRVILNTPE